MSAYRIVIATQLESRASQLALPGISGAFDEFGDCELRIIRTSDAFTLDNVRRELQSRPEGIVIYHTYNGAPYRALMNSGIPTVLIDPSDAALAACRKPVFIVRNDPVAIGGKAADVFLAQKRFHGYGFIGDAAASTWSVERGRAFHARLAGAGVPCSRYEPLNGTRDLHNMAKFLRSLQKPAAVFVACDLRAVEVLDLCRRIGLKVPQQISLIGVDNDALTCEHVSPTLSSVEPDFARSGQLAAEILARVIRGDPPAERSFRCGIRQVVLRNSTLLQDPAAQLVAKAMDYIRKNALSCGITVEDVARHLRVSRPLLDLRFREQRQGTVLKAITAVRIETAKRLLTTTDDKISTITSAVGFESENHFKSVFRRATGMTICEWRRGK